MSDETPRVTNEFAIGSRVAGYRLDAQIGRGGMAVVYRAYDPRLDRRVALKVLAPELARDESFRQRFIRESRAAAAVDHPHIIPVFEAGESDGVLFIAMRYVDGGDVGALIRPGEPLPAARVLGIVTQVASALDAAHARGLVHRDVKPGNMLLDASASIDHVYLSDFGLSKQSLSSSHLTATGQFLGTLDYVAPEQIEGRPVDGRTDLYALACATFELLCGSPPFQREERLAALWAQLSEPPPALTARRADLPPAVDQVMAKALAKSPDDRYRTCLEFAAALRDACGLGTGGATGAGTTGPQVAVPGPGHTVAGSADRTAGSPDPADEPAEPPRPATEAVVRPARPPREILRPETAAATGTGPAATERSAAAVPPHGERDDQATQAGWPGDRGSAGSGWSPGPPPPARSGPPAGRPWWRSPIAIAAACVVVLGLAGGGYAITRGGSGKDGAAASSSSTKGSSTKGSSGSHAVTLSPPGCTTSVAAARVLQVPSSTVRVPGQAYAIAVTANDKYSFISLPSGPKSSIAVMQNGSGSAPTFVRSIPVNGKPHGEAITPDGLYLLVADDDGAVVINVAEAEQGGANPIAGTLVSPGGSNAAQVKITPDGQFAFVTLENTNDMAVFNLRAAIASGFSSSHLVGKIPLDPDPLGMGLSPDGHWLYVTSTNLTKTSKQGGLSIIDLHLAETHPASALKTTVPAGCYPVRVITTDSGKYLWVSARESNALLGFSAAKLLTDQRHALVAVVPVGAEPIGITPVHNGSRILVANSNILVRKGLTSSLSVVSASAALAGKPALLGTIATGQLPRQFAMEPNGKTLLVSNSISDQLQALDVTNLP